jgi:hypothetical protein
MTAVANPAWERFLAQFGRELLLAQVLIRRLDAGYELRHETDRAAAPEGLRLVPVAGLRTLAQFTADRAFRPLKSAPNLPAGWRAVAMTEGALQEAVEHLYPGAIADWFVAGTQPPAVTHYREFTERQTGMYRVTTMLNDEQAGQMVRACCDRRFCLKRRLWTVAGLEPDRVEAKSLIPCLEPCAILLEFARKAVRLEQEEKVSLAVSAGDGETLVAALEAAVRHPDAGEREADFNAPSNSRRMQLTLEKLKVQLAEAKRPKA